MQPLSLKQTMKKTGIFIFKKAKSSQVFHKIIAKKYVVKLYVT